MPFGSVRYGGLALSLFLTIAFISTPAGAVIPAFPGAEGAGAYAVGGRNGDVYHVTNLNDSGTGSLRYGVQNAPSSGRTIVFDVSGTIALNSYLDITKPKITIAGQTAPGLGICITNFGVRVRSTNNIVIQHIRSRPGLARAGTGANDFRDDSLTIYDSQNVIFDHCSASWSIDECMTADKGVIDNITFQWCYITEALHDTTFHPYGPTQKHSDGSLITFQKADGFVTLHHNLWAHNNLRMPRIRSYEFHTATGDVRNNVGYNWGSTAAYGGGDTANLYDDSSLWNFCGNYYIAGPSTSSSHRNYALEDWGEGIDPNGVVSTWDMKVYLGMTGNEGNKIDSDCDHLLDGANTGWGMTTGPMIHSATPFAMPGPAVTMDTADVAYQRVLAQSGALPLYRDSVDARITNEVIAQTGRIINSQKDPNDPLADPNGYPIIPIIFRGADWDTDNDGVPNWWEIANGLNPNSDDHLGDGNGDGYTNIEDYLAYMNDFVVIPEPACMSLALLGGLALLARRRRVATT